MAGWCGTEDCRVGIMPSRLMRGRVEIGRGEVDGRRDGRRGGFKEGVEEVQWDGWKEVGLGVKL